MRETKQALRGEKTVLVAVLKTKDDLRILLREQWYRIPLAFFPKRSFHTIAFYQPAAFGRNGKRIAYYAHVAGRRIARRMELLPKDGDHPRAHEAYVRVALRRIRKLPRPIRNIIPRRVVFGFTTLRTLRASRDILELYGVPKTEQMVQAQLEQLDIPVERERTVTGNGKRYRVDLAVFCRRGPIAIECDNRKAHAGRINRARDRMKDAFLTRHGWRVVRLREADIVERRDACVQRIVRAMSVLGGCEDKNDRRP